jgi:hypothetical protein
MKDSLVGKRIWRGLGLLVGTLAALLVISACQPTRNLLAYLISPTPSNTTTLTPTPTNTHTATLAPSPVILPTDMPIPPTETVPPTLTGTMALRQHPLVRPPLPAGRP